MNRKIILTGILLLLGVVCLPAQPVAECWSPDDDGSNCDRLVRVLEELCDIVKNKDVNRIEGLVPEIEALTVDFTNHIGQEVPQSIPYYDRVSSYLDSLVRDGGSYRAFRLFSLEEIPALLSFADDTREIKSPPANLLSSYLPSSCSVGVYSLWLIDCIRRNEVLIGQRMEQTSEDAPLSPEYARWRRFSLAPELSHGGAHPFREQGLCILPESSGRSISFLVEFRLDRIYSFKGSFGIHRSSLVLTTGFSQFSDNQINKPAVMAGLFSRPNTPNLEPPVPGGVTGNPGFFGQSNELN